MKMINELKIKEKNCKLYCNEYKNILGLGKCKYCECYIHIRKINELGCPKYNNLKELELYGRK